MQKRKVQEQIPFFVATTFNLFDSLVYKRNLNNAARVAYLLLCRQKQKDFWKPQVICPYSTAKDYMNKHAWKRAIESLSENGLIEVSQKGGLFRKTNIYTFSVKWKDIENNMQMVISNRMDNGVPVNPRIARFSGIVGSLSEKRPLLDRDNGVPTTTPKGVRCVDHQWTWSARDRKWKCSTCGVLTYSKELQAVN